MKHGMALLGLSFLKEEEIKNYQMHPEQLFIDPTWYDMTMEEIEGTNNGIYQKCAIFFWYFVIHPQIKMIQQCQENFMFSGEPQTMTSRAMRTELKRSEAQICKRR